MPRFPRPCRSPGCPNTATGGYCPACRRSGDGRLSAAKRGYGRAWERLRRIKLRRQPLCQWPGCIELATDVDHIAPVRRASEVLVGLNELQSLCHAHHSLKTATQDGGFGR